MITNEKIRARLTEAIKQSTMSQAEICRFLGIKPPTMSQYLSGRSLPALDTFANLCQVLDVSADYLLGLED